MSRKFELFKKNEVKSKYAISNTPPQMFRQERDWTCSIACIRTMMSGIISDVPTEDDILEKFQLSPQPYYSSDIKETEILKEFQVIYGCDNKDISFDKLMEYFANDYYVMVECMYNYSHWFVVLGYYPDPEEVENSMMLVYDPYYNKVRMLNVDEFIGMWSDGASTMIKHDFIAIHECN